MDLILRLDAKRCADGVGRVRRQFSWRSRRHEPVVREAADLGNPLVIHFLNANTNDKLIDFLSTFGLPGGFLLRTPEKRAAVRFLSLSDVPEEFRLGAPDGDLPFESSTFVWDAQE